MSWRVEVVAQELEDATAFKDAHFKALYAEAGTKVTYELPDEDGAKALAADAEKAGLKATVEEVDDPLDDAEPVSFW